MLDVLGPTLVAYGREKLRMQYCGRSAILPSPGLEALREIRQAFERPEITEDELQEAGRRARQEIARERDSARA